MPTTKGGKKVNTPRIVVVIPTVRPEQYRLFIDKWSELFKKHKVILVTIWDGETPYSTVWDYGENKALGTVPYPECLYSTHKKLVYRYTDACRNLGFIIAAYLNPDYILTLDDDVAPLGLYNNDPIQEHLNVLEKKVCLSWMNTAHKTELFLRGIPYNNRKESQVMLSHGVWFGTPDFDGETQLLLEQKPGYITKEGKQLWTDRGGGVPSILPYYVGPIPKGVLFPLCGMNVMIKRDALPYFYFAPMGIDTGILDKENKPILNRFADIWMGISLKKEFDKLNWACYTGGSTILHTRASNAHKNFEQEKLGREWNEQFWKDEGTTTDTKWLDDRQYKNYFYIYNIKREEFKRLILDILSQGK